MPYKCITTQLVRYLIDGVVIICFVAYKDTLTFMIELILIIFFIFGCVVMLFFIRTGLKGVDALIIDINKMFDRVSWSYLKEIMLKLGFARQWVNWIYLCISYLSYSILVNNEIVGLIIPGRGIRQGDPLSLFLFIICAEGLSSLIRDAKRNGVLHGIGISHGAPSISHLLFADDNFLFMQTNEDEFLVIKQLLLDYENASG